MRMIVLMASFVQGMCRVGVRAGFASDDLALLDLEHKESGITSGGGKMAALSEATAILMGRPSGSSAVPPVLPSSPLLLCRMWICALALWTLLRPPHPKRYFP
jgi:hypothetical protein